MLAWGRRLKTLSFYLSILVVSCVCKIIHVVLLFICTTYIHMKQIQTIVIKVLFLKKIHDVKTAWPPPPPPEKKKNQIYTRKKKFPIFFL
jgi:hypothetical protein